MKLASISGAMYFVEDVSATAEFYEKLGFIVVDKTTDYVKIRLNWFWLEFVQVEKAEPTVFAKINEQDKKEIGGKGHYLHIGVTNVDEYYKEVNDQGFKPSSEPQDFKWGRREFVLRDPDGYKLVFFSKIK